MARPPEHSASLDDVDDALGADLNRVLDRLAGWQVVLDLMGILVVA